MQKSIESLVTSSGVLLADDEAGILWVKGGKEITDEIRSYVRLFDVKPMRIALDIKVDSAIDRASASLSTVVDNNRPFRFVDDSVGIDLTVAVRVNNDGTMTVKADSSYQTTSITTVFRLNDGKPAALQLGPTSGLVGETSSTPNTRLKWPVITISGSIKRD